MNKQLKEHIIECLKGFKKNIELEQALYKLGVNLLNCELSDNSKVIEMIKFILDDQHEYSMVDWWLCGNDLYLYNPDKTVYKELRQVEDFVEYMTNPDRGLSFNFDV